MRLSCADRIEGLDERPPLPFVEPDLNTPAGIQLDPRRFVPAFISVEARVRAAAVEDYGAAALGDEDVAPFGLDFDISPAAVIFADVGSSAPCATGFVMGPSSSFVGVVARDSRGAPVGVDPRTIKSSQVSNSRNTRK